MSMTRIRQEKSTEAGLFRARLSPHVVASALLSAFLFLAGSESTVDAQSVPKNAGGLRILTTAREAHSLTDEQAKRAYPVHLRGVITYFDPDFGTGQPAIFIHDATGSIFIEMLCRLTCKAADPLFVGALVDVRGVSAPGGFGPIVGNPQIRILGRAPLPPNPPRVSLCRSQDRRGGRPVGGGRRLRPSRHRICPTA